MPDVSAVLASLRQLAEAAQKPGSDSARAMAYTGFLKAFDPPTVLALIAIAKEADELLARYELAGYPSDVFASLVAALAGLAAVRGVS